MGQAGSVAELTQEDIDKLKAKTRFSTKDIRSWHEKFSTDFPDGEITPDAFSDMFCEQYPGGDARDFSRHIFRAYDKDGNNVIDFTEFLETMDVSHNGTPEEKLKWAFNLYDLDGNGSISKHECVEMLTAIYRMHGRGEEASDKAESTALEVFMKLDKNMDDNLSLREMKSAAKNSPVIWKMLNGGAV